MFFVEGASDTLSHVRMYTRRERAREKERFTVCDTTRVKHTRQRASYIANSQNKASLNIYTKIGGGARPRVARYSCALKANTLNARGRGNTTSIGLFKFSSGACTENVEYSGWCKYWKILSARLSYMDARAWYGNNHACITPAVKTSNARHSLLRSSLHARAVYIYTLKLKKIAGIRGRRKI